MLARIRYNFDPERVHKTVLLIWPINRASVIVYCPPIGNELPWIEEVADYDEAVRIASRLAELTGQANVPVTRDKDPWWLDGLTPV